MKLIIGNWKANPSTVAQAKKLALAIERGVPPKSGAEVVICPPFTFLESVSHVLNKVQLGSQDVFWEDEGPYTSQVTPNMLKGLGVRYVIVGHSERRDHTMEIDAMVRFKLQACLRHGLTPILCVGGGTKREWDEHKIKRLVRFQCDAAFFQTRIPKTSRIVVAYEPTWAISKGKPGHTSATPEHAERISQFIRKIMVHWFGSRRAGSLPILYGGSANASNARGFLAQPNINGLLVGAASLKPEEFLQIVRRVSVL